MTAIPNPKPVAQSQHEHEHFACCGQEFHGREAYEAHKELAHSPSRSSCGCG